MSSGLGSNIPVPSDFGCTERSLCQIAHSSAFFKRASGGGRAAACCSAISRVLSVPFDLETRGHEAAALPLEENDPDGSLRRAEHAAASAVTFRRLWS
jgi:hypothetical protein